MRQHRHLLNMNIDQSVREVELPRRLAQRQARQRDADLTHSLREVRGKQFSRGDAVKLLDESVGTIDRVEGGKAYVKLSPSGRIIDCAVDSLERHRT